jgi:leucyl/phenylalanyl-tRNA--protein transferase
MPVEPPPTPWEFPAVDPDGEEEVVAVGADLAPGTLLAAYRSGLFPMPLQGGPLGWWSPQRRGVLPLDGLRVTRSLRQSCKRYEVRVDTAFAEVMRACADPGRPHAWITPEFVEAYTELHRLGWAHSVETWTPGGSGGDGELVGGLYGLRIGGLFAGESMFHRAPDASKVALVALVDMLRADGAMLLDVQWLTPHLASLGAVEIPRREYLARLREAVDSP